MQNNPYLLFDFTNLVLQMRAAQKRYFQYRTIPNLEDAKKWEKIVDEGLKRLEKPQEDNTPPDVEM